MTFRIRTALVVLALTAFTMGSAFAMVWQHFVSSEREELDRANLDIARFEADDAAKGHLEFTDAPGPSAHAVGPLPKYGVLYSTNKHPLTNTGNWRSLPPMPEKPLDQGFDFDHDGIEMRAVVVAVPGTEMKILLATTRDDLENRAEVLARAMALTFVIGCLWAAAVGYGVATRLTRDHEAIALVARAVASGDTSARVALESKDADLRRLAGDLNGMIDQLVGLLGSQERFVAHAAHELRTPLTAMRIEIEHALKTAKDREELEEAMRGSLDSLRRLSRLAEDLLDLARARAAPVNAQVDVFDCVQEAVAVVSPLGLKREVVIIADGHRAIVKGDHGRIVRVLRNLLENAIRFAPSESSVRVEVDKNGVTATVAIIDDGPGVKTNEKEQIFEPFKRAVGNPEGTGLGLAIARELARSVGGDVTVQSGSGGRFLVTLPAA